MKNKTITLINGKTLNDVDLTRWAGDPNFYKVHDRALKKDIFININQIVSIEDYVEQSLSDLPPVRTY
nr:hypothetical protein [uncultured Acetobacterium sp.]